MNDLKHCIHGVYDLFPCNKCVKSRADLLTKRANKIIVMYERYESEGINKVSTKNVIMSLKFIIKR